MARDGNKNEFSELIRRIEGDGLRSTVWSISTCTTFLVLFDRYISSSNPSVIRRDDLIPTNEYF